MQKYEKKCNIENTCKIIKKNLLPKRNTKLISTLFKIANKNAYKLKLYKIVLKTTVHRHIRSIFSHFF